MRILKSLAMSFVTLLALLYIGQRILIFPGAYFLSSKAPEDRGLIAIPLETPDGVTIQLYTFASQPLADKDRKKQKQAILVFHGNADLAARKIYELGFLRDKYEIYALEFHGFNKNKGFPSEETLNMDAKTALKYLHSQGHEEIIYYGHSIGTGVATRLVREEMPLALILEAPFDTLLHAANDTIFFLPKGLLEILLKDKFDSVKTLSTIAVPNVLIMHGAKDDILSIKLGRSLFAQVNSPNKVLKIYETANHMNILQYAKKDVLEFLTSIK